MKPNQIKYMQYVWPTCGCYSDLDPILSPRFSTPADVEPHKMHSNFHFKKFLQSMSLLTDLTLYSLFISSKIQRGIFFLIFHKAMGSVFCWGWWLLHVILPCTSQDYFRDDGLGLHRAQPYGLRLRIINFEKSSWRAEQTPDGFHRWRGWWWRFNTACWICLARKQHHPRHPRLVSCQGTRTMLKNPEGQGQICALSALPVDHPPVLHLFPSLSLIRIQGVIGLGHARQTRQNF